MSEKQIIVNDVTGLNPIPVWSIATPKTLEEVCEALKRDQGPVSVGGGHFSMGGQTASPNSLHLDMRQMNKVISFNPTEKTIHVQAGVRWCDIQKFIDPHNLAVKIMQTYANFTVGGSLSVNVHGRYVGLGPLIMSVRSIKIVLASGEIIVASANENSEIFYGAIGGYGGLGVIVEAELELADNVRIERKSKRMKTTEYLSYFKSQVRSSESAILHNADIYPNHYSTVNAATWSKTDKAITHKDRLQKINKKYWLQKYFFWAFSETLAGKWRREHIIDRLLFSSKKVHWLNYEAGYDAAELEPISRNKRTYVLQEYFVPIDKFDSFVEEMGTILNRYQVNVINISIRHAKKDPGSILAWANDEVFAFVLYYKQRVRENAKQRVALWTRALIDAVLKHDGSYYLPYQAHATHAQFHAAYPKAKELFALKEKLDPNFRFKNVIWDSYYGESKRVELPMGKTNSEYVNVYQSVEWRDKFYLFLQNVFRLFPEDRHHTLIMEAIKKFDNDEAIYRYLQEELPKTKPLLGDLTYSLPALLKQKKIISEQTISFLDDQKTYDGYLEIGSTGRYYAALKKKIKFKNKAYFSDYKKPGKSPVDFVDRGQIGELGQFFGMKNYAPISPDLIADNSLDLVTCYIGLHHVHPDKQKAYVDSIVRVLRPGGVFILRDHNADTEDMKEFVALVHTVFNCGTFEPWEVNEKEPRFFESVDYWTKLVEQSGLKAVGEHIYQDYDPSDNALMAFVKSNHEG